MNLDLFNRVNLKDSSDNKGMYSEWTSLSPAVRHCELEGQSVLEKFGGLIGKEVSLGVVKQLASNLGLTQPAEPSPLTSDKEVHWCMEVICFGLTLPLAEHDIIKDCVNVYCEWLSALLPSPKLCVPKPICEQPNLYSRKIISHLHHLFVPRKGEGQDTINRQAVLCHRVLRTLQQVAHDSKILERDTWESLLLFLLLINDTLLAPPTVKDDVADQLCERVLSVLFEVWLVACARCFPTPPLWKTLRENCMNWRHRIALVEQWNRINLALTSRVLSFMYGPSFPELKIGDEDFVPSEMTNDCIAQSWYRFLNTIGNPINFTKPEVISQTQKFLQFAISSECVMDPCHHPCLQALPLIFLKAIKGIAGQVDAFLGIARPIWWEDIVTGCSSDKNKEAGLSFNTTHSPTPPPQRRLAKSFSVAPSSVTKGVPKASLIGLTSSRNSAIPTTSTASLTSSFSSLTSFFTESRTPLASERAKCNSILHLFGEWLFEAAFIGTDLLRKKEEQRKRPGSVQVEDNKSKTPSLSSQPGSLSEASDSSLSIMPSRFESGRAEALGALCRVMCAKKTGEEILPVYLARFYLSVQCGLKTPGGWECGETLIAILMNSSNLFQVDLDGVRILVPAFVSALEVVLLDKELQLPYNVSKIELRRASIHLLLSLLVLPLHFQNTPIKELTTSIGSGERPPLTFAQLKPRLMNLIMHALQVETDPQNTHLLLGGLFLSVQDAAAFEGVEQVTQPSTETASNLLSSVSDASSTTSMASGSETREILGDVQLLVSLLDSAHALFVRGTYLVCHRLISSWKTDLNISLAALELLSGLARIHIKESDALECKRAVKWLCDYIVYQCSRPPPAHSKDLHSTIVAAFHCCTIWLMEHPYLLQDKDCLTTVLEVAELGVSGTKSIGKPGEKIKMKEEKELKPASLRVRDAAENLLTCVLEQVGYFPSECGPESISSLLDELALLQHCNSWPSDCTDRSVAVKRFRYFVTEGSIMLALLEEPLANDQDAQPTITILIRGPFGRHAWTMQLRHLPRHRSGTKYHTPNPGRPVAMQDTPIRPEVKQKYFSEGVERAPQCKVDQSIPTLEWVLANDEVASKETGKLEQLVKRQVVVEKGLANSRAAVQSTECVPPPVCQEFQTARLFLSHFGFLSLDDNSEDVIGSPTLTVLDNTAPDFCSDLAALDSTSSRTCDTVHIFYVRTGQSSAEEIVDNVLQETFISPHFFEFLHSLGWPVHVGQHPGWTGHASTSWKVANSATIPPNTDKIYDGQSKVLYWADACSEIAFVVPSCLKLTDMKQQESFNTSNLSSWCERAREKRTLSLDLDKQPTPPRRSINKNQLHLQSSTKIIVAWLESYEDYLNLPISDLLPCMNTGLEASPAQASDVLVICLHWMVTGLLRVHLSGPTGRVGLALPLVDGMVVSRRAVGSLVRQTALNMSRRRRLDSDSHSPPHVKRRLKVQEMVQKYKRELSRPELFTYLFRNPC